MIKAVFLKFSLSLFLTVFGNLFRAQEMFSPSVLVTYEMRSVESLMENALPEVTYYVLMANETTAVFKAQSAFRYDSIKQTGVDQRMLMANFDLNEQANIVITPGEIVYSDLVMNEAISYREGNDFKWQIIKEFGEVAGLKCQKAVTEKFGRKWTACFSAVPPFMFGPYKFNGLPGLILEVEDDENHYQFRMTGIKKIEGTFPISRLNQVKVFSKSDYLRVKDNLESDFSLGGKIKLNPEHTRKFHAARELMLKSANPLEREP